MQHRHHSEVRRMNYFSAEMDALYHLASLKLGITDSVSIVLYTIYDEGGACLLRDIYKKSGITKQTVNSAIRRLEGDGILFLEQYNKKSKTVMLTDQGKAYAKKTVERLCHAEAAAFHTWTEEEIRTYMQLMEKYAECFRRQVEKL